MEPQRVIGRESTPDGSELVLYHRGPDYTIRVGGWELMSSRTHGSEEELARLGCGHILRSRDPRVLIGGLGMGYTLRAALNLLPKGARLTVSEVFPAIVAWNRDHLGHLAGDPLDDSRVEVICDDVFRVLKMPDRRWDAILLDVDNGPEALSLDSNQQLYSTGGVSAARKALKSSGRLAVWSASPDRSFERRLRDAGFVVECHTVRGGPRGRGVRHVVFVAFRHPHGEAR